MEPDRILVVTHVACAEHAVSVVTARHPEAAAAGGVDLLVLGRSAERVPTPAGVTRVTPPAGASAALAHVRERRARHYAVGLVVWPGLRRSRARGAIRAYPFAAGCRRVETLDPAVDPLPVPVTPLGAAADAAAFAAVRAVAPAVAAVAARVVERVADRPLPARRLLRPGTAAVYLRTDVDLAAAPASVGGSVAHTAGIVDALRRAGHPVELRSTGGLGGLRAGSERRLPTTPLANVPAELAELASGLLQALRPAPPPAGIGLLYQRYSLNNLAGLLLARRWDVPFVLEANNSEVQMREEWSSLSFPRLARATERLLLARADLVTAVSTIGRERLLAAGASPGRLLLSPNGVDVERFATAVPTVLPFHRGAVVIAFAGLFYPWHGVPHLAAAFAEVARREPDARLLLVGDGEEAPAVRRILAEAGVLERAELTGTVPRDAVPGLLAAADILVSPHADWPGFFGSPIKLFEYLAAGRAIVASRVGQIGEVLEDGRTGVLVPAGDEPALADALTALVRDRARRAALGAAARTEARARHDWDARVAGILEAASRP